MKYTLHGSIYIDIESRSKPFTALTDDLESVLEEFVKAQDEGIF